LCEGAPVVLELQAHQQALILFPTAASATAAVVAAVMLAADGDASKDGCCS
jgi:hypothetical protein